MIRQHPTINDHNIPITVPARLARQIQHGASQLIRPTHPLLRHRTGFMQLHRAFIVSTDRISNIKGNSIQMNNNLHISVGELYRDQFSAFLDEKLLVTSRKH